MTVGVAQLPSNDSSKMIYLKYLNIHGKKKPSFLTHKRAISLPLHVIPAKEGILSIEIPRPKTTVLHKNKIPSQPFHTSQRCEGMTVRECHCTQFSTAKE
jgi:hypothetical protein